jgi:galactose mutarotase-like enzyme
MPSAVKTPFQTPLLEFGPATPARDRLFTSRKFRITGMPTWSVHCVTLHGGKQEGVEIIEVETEKLRLSIIPTRGMNILRVDSGDVRLGWDSPVKEVVHPQFVNLESRSGLGWLDGFNEWFVRCGLEFFGPPGPGGITLHGRISNIPASRVELVVDRVPPYRLRIRGVVQERSMFGADFELATEISLVPGTTEFRVEDQVRNDAGTPRELQLLYHINHGSPLLEAGAKFKGAVKNIEPANEACAPHLDGYETYAAPTPGFAEQVFLIQPAADALGRTLMMLHNAAASRGVTLGFNTAELPCFTLWKNTVAPQDGYVTGLEPGTGYPRPRALEKEAGRIPVLAPGQSRRFGVDFKILSTAAEVAGAARTIDTLCSGSAQSKS